MIRSHTKLLRCLDCDHSPLDVDVVSQDGEHVMDGAVRCSACGAKWPIVRGVPRFVKGNNYALSFGNEWNLFPRTQLDSYTGTTISRDRFEEVTQTEPSKLANKLVLECGCGMGRFLEVLAKAGANVVGIDYSSAVDAAFSNLREYPNVTILQADLFDLPLRPASFYFVYSIGVLHHTPNTRQALRAISRYVRPEGVLSVWVYRKYRLPRPYRLYRYALRHLSAETVLRIVRMYHPLSWRLRRVPVFGRPLSVALPIADYRGVLPLGEQHQLEWSYLDTVDALTPWYESRHSPSEVRSWFEELGYDSIEVGQTPCSVMGCRHDVPKLESSSKEGR